MVGRLLGLAGALVVYLCVGTILAQAFLAAYLWQQGYLTSDTLARIGAVVRGDEPEQSPEEDRAPSETAPQPSLDDVARARALKSRDLELREQSLRNGVTQLNYERVKLLDESDRYKRVKSEFERHLNELREKAVATSEENARLILENIKPKQAKEQIMLMVGAGEIEAAVLLLSEMPIAKRAKVVSEFKTEDESRTLAELLKLIRAGKPELSLIDEAKTRLQTVPPGPR